VEGTARCTLRDFPLTKPEHTHCENFAPSRSASVWQAFVSSTQQRVGDNDNDNQNSTSVLDNVGEIAVNFYYLLEEQLEVSTDAIKLKCEELYKHIIDKGIVIIYYRLFKGHYVWCDIRGPISIIFGHQKLSAEEQIPLPPIHGQRYIVNDVATGQQYETISGTIPQKQKKFPPIKGPITVSNDAYSLNNMIEFSKQFTDVNEDSKDIPKMKSYGDMVLERLPIHKGVIPQFEVKQGKCSLCGKAGEVKISINVPGDKSNRTHLFCDSVHYLKWWERVNPKTTTTTSFQGLQQ